MLPLDESPEKSPRMEARALRESIEASLLHRTSHERPLATFASQFARVFQSFAVMSSPGNSPHLQSRAPGFQIALLRELASRAQDIASVVADEPGKTYSSAYSARCSSVWLIVESYGSAVSG
jgi:hypothetical protein